MSSEPDQQAPLESQARTEERHSEDLKTPEDNDSLPSSKKIKLEEKEEPTKEAPVHEIVGGSSVRQFLNKHVTQYLLEGLKQIGKEKPDDPLRTLGEFLIKKSDEQRDQKP